MESRILYLDIDLVKLRNKLPPEWTVHSRANRLLLRRALQKLLPKSFRERRKQGFGLPVALWFRREMGGQMDAMLGSLSKRTEIAKKFGVTRLLRRTDNAHYQFRIRHLLPLKFSIASLSNEKTLEASSEFTLRI